MRALCLALFASVGMMTMENTVHAEDKKSDTPAVLNFKMKTLEGKDVDLSKYKGKVVLFVNVASKCGYTRQYKGLQALHAKYADKGLAIVGVPCNQFGGQEPGTAEEIAEFCDSKYGVEFDMLEKVNVKGDKICPLYEYLTGKKTNPKSPGKVSWNFEKFLIGRDGEIIGRYKSSVEPDGEKFIAVIEEALAAKK